MTQHEEHRTIVAKRWAAKRKDYKGKDFNAYARKTLLSYGWDENDIEKMMKIIEKGGETA